MNHIRIYRTRKLGLEVYQVYYRGMIVSQFLSLPRAKTAAMQLANKLERGLV